MSMIIHSVSLKVAGIADGDDNVGGDDPWMNGSISNRQEPIKCDNSIP